MILATIRMELPPPKRDEALKILKLMTEYFRIQSGCISCHIYEDLQEKNTILFCKAWRSREELDHHLRSEEYRNVLLVLEMASKEPVVRFDEILNSTGIETVERARQYQA